MNYSNAAKAFIVNDRNELLVIKRRSNDVQKPGMWEIPGGRIAGGEDPFLGVKREIKEETNLEIDVKHPLNIKHFTREDGQTITMMIFLCKALSNDIQLSEEHQDHKWVAMNEAKEHVGEFFHSEIDVFHKLDLGKQI